MRKRTVNITLTGRDLFMVEGLAPFYGSPRRLLSRLLELIPEDRAAEMGVSVDDWMASGQYAELVEERRRAAEERARRRRRHGLRLVAGAGESEVGHA